MNQTPQTPLPMFEVVLKHSGRQLLVVQAHDADEALERALMVFDTVQYPVDPTSEPWLVRQAHPPYCSATFADGYFRMLADLDPGDAHTLQ